MSIKDLGEKIKSALGMSESDEFSAQNASKYYTAMVIILVGLSSFGLGRLSVVNSQNSPVFIDNKAVDQATNSGSQSAEVIGTTKKVENLKSGQYVASKNGSKYYFPWCGGANNISDSNKIWFGSTEEAKAKGYTPASNCKGLK